MNLTVNLPRLREKMNERQLSNARLALESKVSESTIKRILSGSPTTLTTAEMIALALETTVDELTADEPVADPSLTGGEPGNQSIDEDCPGIDADYPAVNLAEIEAEREKDMKAALAALEKVYLERIEDWRQRVEDQKAANARSRRECHVLLFLIVLLVAFVCTMLAVDVFNPHVGWVRE
nr:MAG TPA: Cro/C1-type HTH DNA-binding domain protein [Caudoviricetes sp.]